MPCVNIIYTKIPILLSQFGSMLSNVGRGKVKPFAVFIYGEKPDQFFGQRFLWSKLMPLARKKHLGLDHLGTHSWHLFF